MKNLKVAKKLFISYAVIMITLLGGCVVSVVDLVKLGNQIEIFYDGPFTVNGSANRIHSNFEKMQKEVYRSISNSDPAIVDEAVRNAQAAAAAIEEQLPVIEKHFLGDEQIVDRLEAALKKLAPMREHVLVLAGQNKNAEAADYMENNNILVIREAQKELDSIIESGNTKGEQLVAGLRDRQAGAIFSATVLGGLGVLISIIFGVYITRGITRPVRELEQAARDLASGSLSSIRIDYQSEDELGKLADDMRKMAATLLDVIQDETYLLGEMAKGNFNIESSREDSYVGDLNQILVSMRKINRALGSTLRQINQSSEEVATSSEQVSMGAQTLSQGATEQAASVEELSSTIRDISEQVSRNTENARKASQQSGDIQSDVVESSAYMQDMLEAMDKISESSGKVREIVRTIENIAFKTNILALNAAVEAARAGEHGKGFAVVANEVRSLADQSASASKSTADLIGESLQAVEDGKGIANKTAASLSEVVKGVESMAESMNDIAEASRMQSDAVSQITESVNIISGVVQTNSATAEECAAASEELSSQAQMLRELVDRFYVK